jgi:hypothetical protein
MATALDAAARTAVKAIEAGRMPSEFDRPVVLSLLMRALAAPGASAAAVEGASGALVLLLQSEDDGAAAAAELLAAGSLHALAGALGAAGRAPGAAVRVLGGLLMAAGDISARVAMVRRMADTDGMLSGLVATLPNEDDPEPAECRTLTASILSMLAMPEGAAARIAALPGAAATLATAALSEHAAGARLHPLVTVLVQITGEGAARAWAPAAMNRVIDVMALAADDAESAGLAMITLQRLALAGGAAARRIAAHPAAMRAMANAAAGAADTVARGAAEAALHAVTSSCAEAKAAVASALAALLVANDAASRDRARALLQGAPLSLPPLAVAALGLAAGEVAALKAEVEALQSIPVNTRAAIVELAAAVRGRPG